MTDEYAAGFFDGEGSVEISESRGVYCIKVQVANTNLAVLEEYRAKWGGSISELRDKRPQCKPGYRWIAASNLAAAFLRDVRRHLLVKCAQCELALSFHDWKRQPERYTTIAGVHASGRYAGRPYRVRCRTAETRGMEPTWKTSMKALNRRGTVAA